MRGSPNILKRSRVPLPGIWLTTFLVSSLFRCTDLAYADEALSQHADKDEYRADEGDDPDDVGNVVLGHDVENAAKDVDDDQNHD